MTVFFTSDQHFGHTNIIHHSGRPFPSVETMNEELVARHNAAVGPDDTVYHLGDFAMDDRLVDRILPRLHGTHHLIPGNHDRCHSSHRRHQRDLRRYLAAGFVTVQERVVFDLDRIGQVMLCHLPLRGRDRSDEIRRPKYDTFRPLSTDLFDASPVADILLHGHVHERWRRNGAMINVGVDVWNYTPVSAVRLANYIRDTASMMFDPPRLPPPATHTA